MYEANPIPYEVDEAMRQYSPDEIDTAIRELSADDTDANRQREAEAASNLDLINMDSQPGAMAVSDIGGMTAELGSQLANPNSMV